MAGRARSCRLADCLRPASTYQGNYLVDPAKVLACVAIGLGVCASAAGQAWPEPPAWMTSTLDQGAHPEGCGTGNFLFPRVSAELLSGMGTGRNLQRIAATVLQAPAEALGFSAETALARDPQLAASVALIVTDGAVGSGSLISSDGDILTNWHVVKGFADVGVVFAPAGQDRKSAHNDIVRGRVVRVDEMSDLALVHLAVQPEGRKPLRLSDALAQLDLGAARATADGVAPGASGEQAQAFLERREDRRVGASASPSAALARAAPPPACPIKEVYQGRNADNTGLVAAYDARCTGRVDVEIIVPDDPSRPIVLRADRNLDGKPDILLLDFSHQGQGHWDLSFWDSAFDGSWGLVGHHPGGAIEPSSYESARAYRAGLAAR